MSTGNDFGLTNACIVQNVDVRALDDLGKEYRFYSSEIVNVEMIYKRHSPIINGVVLIKDISNFTKEINIKRCSLIVYIEDIFQGTIYRKFRIVNVDEIYDERKQKMFKIKIQDEISYFLGNLYMSASYKSGRAKALKTIIDEYELMDSLTSTKLKFEMEDDATGSFVINQNSSVLDFFVKESHRIGYSFFQDKTGMYFKSKESLYPDKLQTIELKFMQSSTNNVFKNKIYELKILQNQKDVLDKNPKQKSYYYDAEKKEMVEIKENIDSLYNNIALNKNSEDIQETTGFKTKFQNRSDDFQHKNDILENYLNSNKNIIIVNGYAENDINKIIEVEFNGNKTNTKGQIEGNVQMNGKYIILEIVDKLIFDKLIQKITIGRADTGKMEQ